MLVNEDQEANRAQKDQEGFPVLLVHKERKVKREIKENLV
jgi:hypothetical protein